MFGKMSKSNKQQKQHIAKAEVREFVVPVNAVRPADVPVFSKPQPKFEEIQKFQQIFLMLGIKCCISWELLNEPDAPVTVKFWHQVHQHFYPELTMHEMMQIWWYNPLKVGDEGALAENELPMIVGHQDKKMKRSD